MLLNLVAKIKITHYYISLHDFLWLYYYGYSWFLYDLISFWLYHAVEEIISYCYQCLQQKKCYYFWWSLWLVNVGSSYSHIRGPGVGCWLSDRSNCSHWSFEAAALPINANIYTDQWEPIVIYHYITLTGRYTTMQPTLLTSWLQLLSYNV